ncbi:MAG: WbqC family protein [Bacteroidales bacterium]
MKPILLSTAYFPPVSWMATALNFDDVIIEIHETYPKQTYRNRCKIATSAGALNLTIPVNRINGNHTKTYEIQIDYSQNWQLLHWRTIVTAYSKSPYFLFYRDYFEPLFSLKNDTLLEFNARVLTATIKALQSIDLQICNTIKYRVGDDFLDLRNEFHPKDKTNKSLTFELPRYIQTFEENHGFIPDLSILDLIFNLGPQALPYLQKVEKSLNFMK